MVVGRSDRLALAVEGGNNPDLDLATRLEGVAHPDDRTCCLQALSERMMGFEPTTFCMASVRSVRARSRPFAERPYLQVILTPDRTRANPNEPRA